MCSLARNKVLFFLVKNVTSAHTKRCAWTQKKRKGFDDTRFCAPFTSSLPFCLSFLYLLFVTHLVHQAIWDSLKRYRFDSDSKVGVENDFF